METTSVSTTDAWTNKDMWNTHMHDHIQRNIIQPLKKKEILPCLTAGMDLKGIMQSETGQIEKYK